MTDINSVFLIGRITKDISDKDFSFTKNKVAKLNFSIAVNRSIKNGNEWKNEASFFDVVAWGLYAESLQKKLHKGLQVAVKGALKQDRWEKDGQKFSKVYILAESVQTLANTNANANSQQGATEKTLQGNVDNTNEFPEDIPFF